MIAEYEPTRRRRGALVGLLLVVGLGLVVLTNARAEPFAAAPKDKSASPPAGPAKAAPPKGEPYSPGPKGEPYSPGAGPAKAAVPKVKAAAKTETAGASAEKLARTIESANSCVSTPTSTST